MATVTLAEAIKLGLNDLQAGVIEEIITVDELFGMIPFKEVFGNAYAYNRENVLGTVQALNIGGTITAKAAATYTNVTVSLTTLIGDAEVNQLLVAAGVGGNAGNDLTATQVASKAKSVGRKFQDLFINGDTANTGEFDGIKKLTVSGQTIDLVGANFTLEDLDALLDKVISKGRQVDFITMNASARRRLSKLLRGLGGTTAEYVELSPGVRTLMYNGVPVLRNEWIVNGTYGSPAVAVTDIYAGVFDDGSEKVGISGLIPTTNSAVNVENVGAKETGDEHITRVKMYTAIALHSSLGVARLKNAGIALS